MKRRVLNVNDAEVIKNLQENLSSIRSHFGWSDEALGDAVGLTKQTISNLENGVSQMTKTQYLALMSVVDTELALRNDSKLTEEVYSILDEKIDLTEDQEKILSGIAGSTLLPCAAGLTVRALIIKFSKTQPKRNIKGNS